MFTYKRKQNAIIYFFCIHSYIRILFERSMLIQDEAKVRQSNVEYSQFKPNPSCEIFRLTTLPRNMFIFSITTNVVQKLPILASTSSFFCLYQDYCPRNIQGKMGDTRRLQEHLTKPQSGWSHPVSLQPAWIMQRSLDIIMTFSICLNGTGLFLLSWFYLLSMGVVASIWGVDQTEFLMGAAEY